MLFSLLRILVAVYVILALLMYLLQPRLVYAPSREIERTPADDGMPYEDVPLTAADGVRLHAWWVPGREGAGAPLCGFVLFCHGNAGNLSHRTESVRVFHELGLGVLIFDYRGYGRSEGKPTEKGTYLDAEAAWKHLVEARGAQPGRVVVFGRSLGGALAAHVAAARRPGALVLESTFTSIPDMAAQFYPWLPARLLSRYEYRTEERIGSVECPLLVVHSPDDELVPFAHGRQLYEAASEPKAFLQIAGDHNNGWYDHRETYVAGLRTFLEERICPGVLTGTQRHAKQDGARQAAGPARGDQDGEEGGEEREGERQRP